MKLRNSSLWGIWLDLAFFLLFPKKGSNGIHLFFRLFSTFLTALSFKNKGKTERSVESDILSNVTCCFFVFSCFLLIRLKITWDFSWFWVWGGLGLFNFTLLLYKNGEETTAMWPKKADLLKKETDILIFRKNHTTWWIVWWSSESGPWCNGKRWKSREISSRT